MAYISSGGGRQQPGGINEMYVYQRAKSAKKKKTKQRRGKSVGERMGSDFISWDQERAHGVLTSVSGSTGPQILLCLQLVDLHISVK